MEDPRLPQRHAPARIADLVHRMHRWRLRDVTLAHVLDGQTCSPIGLDDFEAYMTFLANSLQDLQFIVWFHDYAGRFFALPQELQKRCPGPSSDNFPEKRYKFYHRTKLSVTTWASGESGVELEALKKDVSTAMSDSHDHGEDARPANRQPCPFRGRLRALSSAVRSMSSQSRSESLGGKDSTVPGVSSCEPGCICAQPLREECLNIAHTFLRPTSNKFLDTDKELMYQTIQRLTETTHPVAFIQLYERVYDNLERVHLRQFFVMATMNLNSRQQWTWYWISISNLLASLAIALSTILLIPRGNPNTRAWRSFSVPFFWLFAISLYSGWSGVCPIFWYKARTALHPWELEEADGETRWRLAGTPRPGHPPQSQAISLTTPTIAHTRPPRLHSLGHGSTASTVSLDSGESAPDIPTLGHPTPPTIQHALVDNMRSKWYDSSASALELGITSRTALSRPADTTSDEHSARGRNGFRRNPIFGPFHVVRDARIRTVHRRTVQDCLAFSTFSTLVFCAVLYSVPGLH